MFLFASSVEKKKKKKRKFGHYKKKLPTIYKKKKKEEKSLFDRVLFTIVFILVFCGTLLTRFAGFGL